MRKRGAWDGILLLYSATMAFTTDNTGIVRRARLQRLASDTPPQWIGDFVVIEPDDR